MSCYKVYFCLKKFKLVMFLFSKSESCVCMQGAVLTAGDIVVTQSGKVPPQRGYILVGRTRSRDSVTYF